MILHVDMDAFYASVEQRDDPSLRGKPVIVGGSSEGRGVVAAASYEAREYGVHSAMSAKVAVRLCPHAVFVRPRIDYYAKVSKTIHTILESFTPMIEPLSLDEAFLDVSGTEMLHGSALSIAQTIKRRIADEVGLIASVGVAPNKFLAKIASDLEKPNGLVVVDPNRIQEFLDPLPIGRIWGVGKVTSKVFERMAVTRIGQLRQLPLESVRAMFGNSGEHYWRLAHGQDARSVVPDREAKSISNETTFSHDIEEDEVLREWLVVLVEQVARRLRAHAMKGRTVDLKLRLSDFHTWTRSMSLAQSTDITQELLDCAYTLFDRLPPRSLPVRLLGFGVSGLEDGKVQQMELFADEDRDKLRQLDSVADQIAKKFGKDALHRAKGMGHSRFRSPED